jgi:Beta-propeller domains of methanol dehydrogenase type
MKKYIASFILFLGSLFFTTFIHADELIIDDAQLFTDSEKTALNKQAEQLSEQIKGKVFIYTNNATYDDPEYFTDRFLADRIGNNNNGAIFMLNMSYRDYHFSTSGNMIDYLTERRFDDIENQVTNYLGSGAYYQAASVFLSLSSKYVEQGVPRGHYRIDRDTGKITYYKVLTPIEATIALVVAAAVALAFFFIIKSKYQLKHSTYYYNYNQKSSLKLQQHEDHLVNSFITTRRIPRNNSGGGSGGGGGSFTHSSGGGSFGGRGGKF